MKTQTGSLWVVVACLGMMASPAVGGDSRGIEFFEDSYSGEIYVPCLNESVFESGVILVAYQEFETPSGRVHVVYSWKEVRSFWTGLSTGYEWTGQGNSPGQFNGKLEKGQVEQYVSNYQMTPINSDAPNVKVQYRFKMTVNGNGELVVDRFDASWNCLGSGK